MPAKQCDFMKQEIQFSELRLGKDGIRADPVKVNAITSWPNTETLNDLRSCPELIQLFQRFIKDFSGVAALLTNLTKKDRGIQKWDSSCEEAF